MGVITTVVAVVLVLLRSGVLKPPTLVLIVLVNVSVEVEVELAEGEEGTVEGEDGEEEVMMVTIVLELGLKVGFPEAPDVPPEVVPLPDVAVGGVDVTVVDRVAGGLCAVVSVSVCVDVDTEVTVCVSVTVVPLSVSVPVSVVDDGVGGVNGGEEGPGNKEIVVSGKEIGNDSESVV